MVPAALSSSVRGLDLGDPSTLGVDFTAEATATGDSGAVDLQDLAVAFFLFGAIGTMCVALGVVVVVVVVVALPFLAGNFLAAVAGTL